MTFTTDTAVALLSLAFAIYLGFTRSARKPKRELAFGALYSEVVAGAAKEYRKNVQIQFDGSPVNEARLVIASIMNTGNEPIRADDFQEPMYVQFSGATSLLRFSTAQSSPSNLNVQLHQTAPDTLRLDPILLNPGDYLTIQAITDSAGPIAPAIHMRVAGVKQPLLLKAGKNPGWNLVEIFQFGGFAIFLLFVLLSNRSKPEQTIEPWFFGTLFAIAVIVTAGEIVKTVRINRSRWMGKQSDHLMRGPKVGD